MSYEADVLTLGYHIAHTMNLHQMDNDFFSKLAHRYIEQAHIDSPVKLHTMTKQLLVGDGQHPTLELIDFILNYDTEEPIISEPIRLTNTGAFCEVTVFKNVSSLDSKDYPFYIADFCHYCDTFITVDNVESICHGAGSALLMRLTTDFTVPIILQAGFLHYGDYEVGSTDILERLVEYYESLGFKDVNNKIGNYEEAVTMIYYKKLEELFGG